MSEMVGRVARGTLKAANGAPFKPEGNLKEALDKMLASIPDEIYDARPGQFVKHYYDPVAEVFVCRVYEPHEVLLDP